MTFIEQNFEALLTLAIVGIGFIVSHIRLEGKMNAHENLDIERFQNFNRRQDETDLTQKELRTKHDQLENKIVEKLSIIEKSLAKIEGKLEEK